MRRWMVGGLTLIIMLGVFGLAPALAQTKAAPPVKVEVVLKPGETEVIGSNLDSAQTAHLFELARLAFEREVQADASLRARARGSAERAIRGLLLSLGFEEVRFTDGEAPRT